MREEPIDCLIVGGGPAGLTAAIYLARFHLSVHVVDAGDGRALSIPRTHNHAGFPEGISGQELIARMTDQAQRYGALVSCGRVTRVERRNGLFEAQWSERNILARTVLLATGVRNRRPLIDDGLHERALASGHIRYCPICDGYEVTDRKVAVIGTAQRGTNEAIFLRSFTSDVTLLSPDHAHMLEEKQRQLMARSGIRIIEGPSRVLGIDGGMIIVETPAAQKRSIRFIRHWARTSMHPWQRQWARQFPTLAASRWTAISAHRSRLFMRRGMSLSASIRSAMPWAKAASQRRRSEMTSRRNRRCSARHLQMQSRRRGPSTPDRYRGSNIASRAIRS